MKKTGEGLIIRSEEAGHIFHGNQWSDSSGNPEAQLHTGEKLGEPVKVSVIRGSRGSEPYLAKITGSDEKYGFKHQFIEPSSKEGSSSNLTHNYQVTEPGIYKHGLTNAKVGGFGGKAEVNGERHSSGYVHINPNGGSRELTREEVARVISKHESNGGKSHFAASEAQFERYIIKAAHGEVTGKPSFGTLQAKVNAAIQEDPRWDLDKHGFPEGHANDWEPYCVDILVPDDDGQMCAVIRTDDGRLVKHDFEWDGEDVKMADGDSQLVTPVYSKFIKEKEKNMKKQTVKAAGNSDGAGKGHAMRKTDKAREASKEAHEASATAHETHEEDDHKEAAEAHEDAHDAHEDALKAHAKATGSQQHMDEHMAAMAAHKATAEHHAERSGDDETKARLCGGVGSDVLRCRDCGVPVKAEKVWKHGEEIAFQWMPAGINTITANWGSRAVRLTVDCSEKTAGTVQASFERALKSNPRRPPFGCVEHREQERAFEPKGFEWREDPEPGVFCAVDPSDLGAHNVNGGIHTSFSPSFMSDADYHKSICSECGDHPQTCKCTDGILEFPSGVRGSESNPAEVTGVSPKSVGSLTNWNAFKTILPVTARQPDPQAAYKQNAESTTGLSMEVKLIKSRGSQAAGTYVTLDDTIAVKAIASGEALEASAARAAEAQDKRIKDWEDKDKARNETAVKAAVARGKARGAIKPKDEDVEKTALAEVAKGASTEFVVQFIDGISASGGGTATGTNGSHDYLSQRAVSGSADDSRGRIEVTAISMQDASEGVIKAMTPQTELCRGNRWGEALALSREAGTIMNQRHMKIIRAGGDYLLREMVKGASAVSPQEMLGAYHPSDVVRAATFSDPNSQVGALAGDLILMRNLGYLVNKLNWIKFLTTDLSGEPAKFGQAILTRYITPPGVLTWVSGVGFTSDAGTIAAASAGTTQSGATTQASGTVTKSVPSTTDKSVTMNMFKATEIEFPISLLMGTVRNLLSEQLGAQTYSLAEAINKDVLGNIFAATWNGVISTYTKALANWTIQGLVDLKTALTVSKVPDVGRFVLLHTFYSDKLLQDTNLLTAKAIMAVIKGDASSFETAEVPAMFGLKPLESQLASATNAGALTTWTDPAVLGTTNEVGFAGNMSSFLFVSRPPQDWTTTLTQLGIPITASIRLVTEPDSGLTVMVFSYADNGKMSVSQRVCLMWGDAQGDPRIGIVFKAA